MATNGMKSVNFDLDTRTQFCVDGDETRVFYLDIHDVNLVSRLTEAIPKMQELQGRWNKLTELSNNLVDDTDENALTQMTDFADTFNSIEHDIRQIIDEAFNSHGLCDVVLGDTSAFSPINGRFKYEQIIDVLVGLYEKRIGDEAKKFNRSKVNAKTSKYLK